MPAPQSTSAQPNIRDVRQVNTILSVLNAVRRDKPVVSGRTMDGSEQSNYLSPQ